MPPTHLLCFRICYSHTLSLSLPIMFFLLRPVTLESQSISSRCKIAKIARCFSLPFDLSSCSCYLLLPLLLQRRRQAMGLSFFLFFLNTLNRSTQNRPVQHRSDRFYFSSFPRRFDSCFRTGPKTVSQSNRLKQPIRSSSNNHGKNIGGKNKTPNNFKVVIIRRPFK